MKSFIVSKYQNCSVDSITIRKENGEVVPDDTKISNVADLKDNEFLYFFFSSVLGESKSSETPMAKAPEEKVTQVEVVSSSKETKQKQETEKSTPTKTLKDFPASERPKISRLKNEAKLPIEVVIELYEKNDRNVKKTKEAITKYKEGLEKK